MGSNYAETRNFVTKSKSLNHVVALWNVALADAGAKGRLHYSIEKGGVRLRRDERQRKDRHIVGPCKNLSGPSAKFSIGDGQPDCSIGHHPYRGTWKDGYRAPGRLGNHAQ